MARERRARWHKQGDLDLMVRYHYTLPAGITLTDADVELHQETSAGVWVDRSGEVTASAAVVAALDDDGVTALTGGTARAVRVTITADADAQPDSTDEPEPATNYRLAIIVTRSDTSRPDARNVDLTILP